MRPVTGMKLSLGSIRYLGMSRESGDVTFGKFVRRIGHEYGVFLVSLSNFFINHIAVRAMFNKPPPDGRRIFNLIDANQQPFILESLFDIFNFFRFKFGYWFNHLKLLWNQTVSTVTSLGTLMINTLAGVFANAVDFSLREGILFERFSYADDEVIESSRPGFLRKLSKEPHLGIEGKIVDESLYLSWTQFTRNIVSFFNHKPTLTHLRNRVNAGFALLMLPTDETNLGSGNITPGVILDTVQQVATEPSFWSSPSLFGWPMWGWVIGGALVVALAFFIIFILYSATKFLFNNEGRLTSRVTANTDPVFINGAERFVNMTPEKFDALFHESGGKEDASVSLLKNLLPGLDRLKRTLNTQYPSGHRLRLECGIYCRHASKLFQESGLEADVVIRLGPYHGKLFWNEHRYFEVAAKGEKWIVDLTAEQFEKPLEVFPIKFAPVYPDLGIVMIPVSYARRHRKQFWMYTTGRKAAVSENHGARIPVLTLMLRRVQRYRILRNIGLSERNQGRIENILFGGLSYFVLAPFMGHFVAAFNTAAVFLVLHRAKVNNFILKFLNWLPILKLDLLESNLPKAPPRPGILLVTLVNFIVLGTLPVFINPLYVLLIYLGATEFHQFINRRHMKWKTTPFDEAVFAMWRAFIERDETVFADVQRRLGSDGRVLRLRKVGKNELDNALKMPSQYAFVKEATRQTVIKTIINTFVMSLVLSALTTWLLGLSIWIGIGLFFVVSSLIVDSVLDFLMLPLGNIMDYEDKVFNVIHVKDLKKYEYTLSLINEFLAPLGTKVKEGIQESLGHIIENVFQHVVPRGGEAILLIIGEKKPARKESLWSIYLFDSGPGMPVQK